MKRPEPLAKTENRYLIRAGFLAVTGLFIAVMFVYLIGKRQHLFTRTVTYSASFENVEGLAVEAPVWLGGIEVGRVIHLSLRERNDKKSVWVHLEVMADYQGWVRADSVASITGRGLLGDKALDVSLGSQGQPELSPGAEIISASSMNFDSMMRESQKVLTHAVAISESLRQVVEGYAQPQLHDDVRQTVSSLRRVMEAVEDGDGAVHSLIFDEKKADELQRGFTHLANAAENIDGWVAQAKNNPGSLMALLGAEDSGQLLADLASAAQDIKEVTAKVKDGQGSLGGIIQDPTVYEDLKLVLGNLKRNRVLRAMVRFLVSHQEADDKTPAQQSQR